MIHQEINKFIIKIFNKIKGLKNIYIFLAKLKEKL